MGAWIKLFEDGTKEYGSDENIIKGKASWSKGQLDSIRRVTLLNSNNRASLSVPETSWHQFDRYQAVVAIGKQKSTITHRVVQAEITLDHVGQFLVCSSTEERFFRVDVQNLKDFGENDSLHKLITKDHIGKWLTIILPEKDNPTITFSIRGKMNDNQYISKQRH